MGYKPPSISEDLLGSINSLFNHPKINVVSDRFIGKKFLCELPGGQLYFESALDVDTDGSVYSKQDPFGAKPDRSGVSPTSATDAAGKFLDADKINYFVLPKGGFDTTHHIGLGDVAVVISGTRVAYACFGDRGQNNKLGEGSIALHRALGHETVSGGRLINAAKGGEAINSGVITIVFPGTGNGSGLTNDQCAAIGQKAFQNLKSDAYKYEMDLLARYKTRQILIPDDRDELVAILSEWMQEVLDHTLHEPGTDGDGEDLVNNGVGVDTLLYAPLPTTPMAVAGKRFTPQTKSTVYADLVLGHTASGRWFVKQVRFHLNPVEQAQAVKAEADAAKADLRARLLERARARQ
ncbi:MAG: glycoside hydrolase family 75 protein [Acidobacteriia bacterium]|nr:glycoside hydrolase family 75 protein [Terriglobia bacterium]